MPPLQRLGTMQLLFNAAQHKGLRPSWVVSDSLFAVSVNGKEEYVNFARSPLNSSISVNLAKNKYFTRKILERHNVRNIPFQRPRTQAMACAFLAEHGKIIAKPLEGSGSQNVHIITIPSQLYELQIDGYILEKYIRGKELRYLVLEDAILAVHESRYGDSVAANRALQRISYPPELWDDRLCQESMRIARAMHLRFAAVDYLIDDQTCSYLLEVNTTPGLKWFHAPTSGPTIDVADRLLDIVCSSKIDIRHSLSVLSAEPVER